MKSKRRISFFSALANLFVDNDGLSKENSWKDVEVAGDKIKSFWNYFWLGLKRG